MVHSLVISKIKLNCCTGSNQEVYLDSAKKMKRKKVFKQASTKCIKAIKLHLHDSFEVVIVVQSM